MTAIAPGFFTPIGGESTAPPESLVDVPFANPMTINTDLYPLARVVLTGPTVITLTGTRARFILCIQQDGAGNRAYSFNSSVRFSTDLPSFTGSTAANKQDKLGFLYEPNATKFDLVAFVGGF